MCLSFLWRQARQQGVEEHDALGRAEAGKVGIAMRAALRAIHHEQALGSKADAAHQTFNALAQAVIGERRELVEERCNDRGEEHQHQQLESAPYQPGIQPPEIAGLFHQHQDDPDQRQADRSAQQGGLDKIGDEKPGRHLVEAETLLHYELLVVLERKIDQARDHRKGGEQADLVTHAGAGRADHFHREPLQAAQQCEADQHRRTQEQSEQAKFGSRNGVVRCLLVGSKRHRFTKLWRNRGAMGQHMTDVAARKPAAHRNRQQQEADECDRKQQRRRMTERL
jgi:hypothetical protein